MKFEKPIAARELATRFGASLIGDDTLWAAGINEIHKVESGDIAFSDAKKYFEKTLQSAATVILLNEAAECPPGKVILVVSDPFRVYNTLVEEHRPFEPLRHPVDHRARIHPSVLIEPGAIISPNVQIGEGSYIGANAYIGPFTEVGKHVVIGPGAIIGSDAFYYKKHGDGHFEKWRSGGRVILHDHVDIGAGSTINKGVSGDTIIGEGTKVDCQVHIGHGAVIGKNCLFAAQVGIGGKTIVEDNVVLYGQVGIAQALHIGKGAIILAKSGVSKSLEGGKTYFGIPADEVRGKYKELAALRQLPDVLQKLR